MFEILLSARARKSYEKLDDRVVRRLNSAIEALGINPFSGKDIKRMRGTLEGRYRLRVGSLRVIYRIEVEEALVVIESIGARGDIYKKR